MQFEIMGTIENQATFATGKGIRVFVNCPDCRGSMERANGENERELRR